MKLSRCLLGALALSGFGMLAGCTPVGDVEFKYALLADDGTGNIAAFDCADLGVSSVRFAVGDDLDGNGVLDDGEETEFAVAACNEADANLDGVIDATEIGQFDGLAFTASSFTSFSVEFLDAGGNPIPWQTFDTVTNATKFTFNGGISIAAGVTNIIPFQGDGTQLDGELQSFFGF